MRRDGDAGDSTDAARVPARPWRWLKWATPAVLIAVCVAIDSAIDKLLGQAALPGGQFIRRMVDALIAALLTGCLWALASLFGSQTARRRILKVVAILVMLACTVPLAMCSLMVDIRFT